MAATRRRRPRLSKNPNPNPSRKRPPSRKPKLPPKRRTKAMPRPSKGPRLGAGPAHERAILRGLSRALIEHGRIVTTETKAKRVRPFVEKLITKARKGGLHNRRLVIAEIGDKKIVHELFDRVAARI